MDREHGASREPRASCAGSTSRAATRAFDAAFARVSALMEHPRAVATRRRASTARARRVMMFLQYAIWGAWLPFLWLVPVRAPAHAPASRSATMFAAGAVGAIVAPFVAGQIADRWFATEKFLGDQPPARRACSSGSSPSDRELPAASCASRSLYSLVYAPTMPLTNSLAFHHLPDRDRDFGRVRLWGTFGWIASGIAMGQWLLRRTRRRARRGDACTPRRSRARPTRSALSAILGVAMGAVLLHAAAHAAGAGRRAENATLEALGRGQAPAAAHAVPARGADLLHPPVLLRAHRRASSARSRRERRRRDQPDLRRRRRRVDDDRADVGDRSCSRSIPLVAKRVSRKTLLAVGLARLRAAHGAVRLRRQDSAAADR